MYYAQNDEVYCEVPEDQPRFVAICDDDAAAQALADQLKSKLDVEFFCDVDGNAATLRVHATDEGIVFDVWQGDEVVRSGYLFVDDIVAMTLTPASAPW